MINLSGEITNTGQTKYSKHKFLNTLLSGDANKRRGDVLELALMLPERLFLSADRPWRYDEV